MAYSAENICLMAKLISDDNLRWQGRNTFALMRVKFNPCKSFSADRRKKLFSLLKVIDDDLITA